ncbi:MAG: FkbM family methyltransferase [Lysobacteraceae bacterium]|nr:MAG: FkbM family methyltransferase [Xanthomonadaceae bacterium]
MSSHDIEKMIRRTANLVGVDIHRHRPEATQLGRLSSMLSHHGVDLVFDVGANSGQFASALRTSGYGGRIVSFEPLSSAHADLVRHSRDDPDWDPAPRTAIGDRAGELVINVSANSVSSSALGMLDSHSSAAPESAYRYDETAPVTTLDAIAEHYLRPGSTPFLKIDTQGYEDRVLDGATALLSRSRGLQLELSFVPLYAEQKLFGELSARLLALGFSIWAIWPGLCDPASGRMLQVDVTFFRD